jgi:hypothetical protein
VSADSGHFIKTSKQIIMNIKKAIQIALGIHKFLHSQTGKKYIAIWWPRFKRVAKKYVGLAPLTLIEKIYKRLDDTKYDGIAIDRGIAKEFEYSDAVSSVKKELPLYEDIWDQWLSKMVFKSTEQGQVGTCAIWTFNNMVRLAKRTFGLQDNAEEIGITLAYRDLKHRTGDSGTVVTTAIGKMGKQGIPTKSWETIFHRKNLEAVEQNTEIENGWEFVMDLFSGEYKQAKNFADAVDLDGQLGPEWQMQVSVDFSEAMKWFGQEKPFMDYGKSFVRTGGHSIAGVRNSFSIDTDGDEVFVIIDSAYYAHEDGLRRIEKLLVDAGIVRIRFVKMNIVADPAVVPEPTTPEVRTFNLKPAYYGESGKKIGELQDYLASQGDASMKNQPDVFGPKTARAVLKWQLKHIDLMPGYTPEILKRYGGRYFGPASIKAWQTLSTRG